MNILKPKKISSDNLRKIGNFIDEITNNEEIEKIFVEDYINNENVEVLDVKIEKAIMNNVEITNGNLQNNMFVDVEFNNCNFSNTSFEKSCFIRCEFNNCKLTGCNFIDSRMYNVAYKETNLYYSNF